MSPPTAVIREITPPHTALAFPALQALRPAYTDAPEFVQRVDAIQRAEGYRLVGVFAEPDEHALSVAGFRVGHNLAWGHYFYVDDLSTVPGARRAGHAARLLDWLVEEAARLGCDEFHLDSGVGLHRAEAHRLYLNARLAITSFHFARPV